MKIVHLCISQSYFDNWGYQENLIPDYQAEAGHQVAVISTNKFYPAWLNEQDEGYILSKGNSYFLGKVKIIRLNVFRPLGTHIVFTYNLYKSLKKLNPDIIFHHEMTNFSTIICSIYKLFNPSVVYFIDSHSDLRNSASSKVSELLYFKGFLSLMHRFVSIFVSKYYGVTPSRCDFLISHYGISLRKVKFLPIGCDVRKASRLLSSDDLRKRNNISSEAFVIVSGGKMGKFKGTDLLIKAVEELRRKSQNLQILLFGTFEDEETKNLADSKDWIVKFGWCDRKMSLELLKLADMACWPIHHTTLIEDSISVHTPLLIRKTSTTNHLVSGNGLFLEELGSIKEISTKIEQIQVDRESYKKGSEEIASKLSYSRIANEIVLDSIIEFSK